ncbi:MAG: hypothetical protein K5876_06420 [Ruminiclostridium sp.]|nr:hypothetical protein [Ruminiclostridium sp.]
MFYDALSENTVKITLTSRDMSEYAIARESLLGRSAESKRTLTRFLKRFQSESSLFAGKSPDRLFLEAFPSDDGGCVMYVSTLGTENPARGTRGSASVTVMCASPALTDIARFGAAAADRLTASALYRIPGEWCLVVTAERSLLPELSRLAEEYGSLSDDSVDIACVAEHGELVCRDGAAAALTRLI